MDAQQRLLLERSWEVLQNGPRQDVSSAGATSVFVGIGTVEYTAMASHLGIGIYMATGQLAFNLVVSFPKALCTPVLTMQLLQQLCFTCRATADLQGKFDLTVTLWRAASSSSRVAWTSCDVASSFRSPSWCSASV